MSEGCHSCHHQYDVQKQHRISNRIVRRLDVPTKLVVQSKALV